MGIIDSFKKMLGNSPKKNYSTPFIIKTKIHPLRLKSKTNDSVTLDISITNVSDEEITSSIKIKTDRGIGTDMTTLKKQKLIKLDKMKPGEQQNVSVQIYSSSKTQPGIHKVAVIGQTHYRDYDQIVNAARKMVEIRSA